MPQIKVEFRPIIAATEEKAWNKAHDIVRRIGDRVAAILDYIDLGVDIISVCGYDLLADAIDIGRHVIPIVREEVAKRDQAAAGTGG